jgi:hypothetical protein
VSASGDRYAPEHPFPPYAYLPGRDPHPTRHPDGHSHGVEEAVVQAPDPGRYVDCEPYLFGVDLYNHGYHWEAHEVWEALWHASGDRVQREHLQALIQAAAAGVQHRLGHDKGRSRLARRASERLRTVEREAGHVYMGIQVSRLATELGRFAFGGDRPPRIYLR